MQIELRRRLSRGLQVNGSYQYAIEGGSSFLGFHYGREMQPAAHVRHAVKTQWTYTVPVGRDQRFGVSLHPILNAILGGWEVHGTGRVQERPVNIIGPNTQQNPDQPERQAGGHDCRRVDEGVSLPAHHRSSHRPADHHGAAGRHHPDTRRAFNTSTTSPTGYSDLGVPEGRYLAPANSAECIEMTNGDCAPATLLIRTPIFTRFDMGAGKKFPIAGKVNFEFRVDVLNVFNSINFDPATTTGAGATAFQTTTAYNDSNNTFDLGGRLGMLVFG